MLIMSVSKYGTEDMKKMLSALLRTCAFALPVMAESDLEMWKPLADQGDAEAQATLGTMYEHGFGGATQNYAEAYALWSLAASNVF